MHSDHLCSKLTFWNSIEYYIPSWYYLLLKIFNRDLCFSVGETLHWRDSVSTSQQRCNLVKEIMVTPLWIALLNMSFHKVKMFLTLLEKFCQKQTNKKNPITRNKHLFSERREFISRPIAVKSSLFWKRFGSASFVICGSIASTSANILLRWTVQGEQMQARIFIILN